MSHQTETMQLQHQIEQFLYQVSATCDAQDWDAYLQAFAENVEFHIPQWDSEHQHTTDPKREMSLMYYANRGGLEDRIFRIRTGKSAASSPMPRTLHLISNVRHSINKEGLIEVHTNWVTHYFRFGESHLFFGNARYLLEKQGDTLKIRYKQAILMNDKIESVLDFYHV